MKALVIKSSLAAVCLMLVAWTPSAFSQQRSQSKQDSLKKAVELELKEKETDVTIFLDKIEILGRVEKPQTVFILPGQNPIVEDIYIDRSFFKEIFRSIDVDGIRKEIVRARRKKLR